MPESIQLAVTHAGLKPLTDSQAQQFSTYAALLEHWNSKLNLTAIRDPKQILERHFVESIFCAQHLVGDPTTLLDFGSGAGFPGIPIAICRDDISITLLESTAKKASFLNEVVRSLGLSSKVFSSRAEAMPASQTYSAVTLRAVDKMELALPVAIARVKPGGHLALMTTTHSNWSSSLGELVQVSSLPLPNSSDRILAQFLKR